MDSDCNSLLHLNNINENPSCPHGPMLLFRRIANGMERSFYACSTCRNRKDCNFFLWADEKLSCVKAKAWELEKERLVPKINHEKLYKQFLLLKTLCAEERAFCNKCNCLLIKSDINEKHSGHNVKINITDHNLEHPSELLQPLVNAKKEAQYFFTSCTTSRIVGMLHSLGIRKVLCICAPRIHELIRSEKSLQMKSLLLDIDYRYHNFYNSEEFCWFNAFNNYFFSHEESLHTLRTFLENGDERIGLVMDPPFGGRVEPLANTVQELIKLHRELCPAVKEDLIVFWIFPYFMEPQILASCPGFTMLDYKVNYNNHISFASGPKGRKYGSPVRIFTNARPEDIVLPEEEGYKYCSLCQRWVSEENQHCKFCSKCTSKDGQTYVHCGKCKRCVKPSWKHCNVCKRCCLPSHVCGEFIPSNICFNCGEAGHKKQDCAKVPYRLAISVKLDGRVPHPYSKKRKIQNKTTNISKRLCDRKILSSKQKRIYKSMTVIKRKRKKSNMK
ncbi:hypothetical protein L9F63_015341 [Diploptera punctata]|uniref:Zinc finger CCHC domain-containing protein 4 n=1 Tax=Diploptera punctata TaxID=6984 RepID=A0AAD8A5S6_DIPPU|nr:hypothetical protein L9F63_015341 [Diploptera punctata]